MDIKDRTEIKTDLVFELYKFYDEINGTEMTGELQKVIFYENLSSKSIVGINLLFNYLFIYGYRYIGILFYFYLYCVIFCGLWKIGVIFFFFFFSSDLKI